MRLQATHFVEVWKGIRGVVVYSQAQDIELLPAEMRFNATFGFETIAIFKIKNEMKEEKLRLPINYASLERAVTRLDLDLQKQLMEFLKSEIKRKEKEEEDELRKMI